MTGTPNTEEERTNDDEAPIGGRLIEQGSGDVDEVDDEKENVASLGDSNDDALSPEESAMHITDSP